jgi:hypothetical protein
VADSACFGGHSWQRVPFSSAPAAVNWGYHGAPAGQRQQARPAWESCHWRKDKTMLSNGSPMPSDAYENIVPLSEYGFEDVDLIDIYWRDCPEGGKEFVYEMTEKGNAILRKAAARAGIAPAEYMKKLMLRPHDFHS